ncbi:MAG: hypothetical protein IKG96_03055 [Bacteroidaceae bacterium]|nr:hypothetical protein [Bacteroidaceae bacterium]
MENKKRVFCLNCPKKGAKGGEKFGRGGTGIAAQRYFHSDAVPNPYLRSGTTVPTQ